MRLLDLWDELEAQLPAGVPGRQQRRILPDSPADLLLAVTAPHARRCLLLSVDDTAVADVDRLPSARGLEILLHRGASDGRSTLELQLVDPALLEVFAALAQDVAQAAAAGPDDEAAVRAWLGRLGLWQRMLRLAPRGLSAERQRGLWGELHFITELLASATEAAIAVEAWTGPEGAVHDFQTERGSVEVKTSAAHEPQVVRINGERQLDDVAVPALHLLHLSIEVRRGTGLTLPQAVGAARELVADGPGGGTLEDRLLGYGYHDIHEPLYRDTGYELRATNLFTVREGFPRIVEADLIDGVGRVHYDLAIDACAPHRVEPALVLAELTTN